jgi:Ser/Thr protein kinase RdoA (MazF antagonist)
VPFTKHYRTTDAADRAQAHHTWLGRLGLPVPALIARRPQALVFRHIRGRHVAPADVPAAARLLGTAHAAAHRSCLHRAQLDERFPLPGVGPLEPFAAGRIPRVRQLLNQGAVPTPAFTADEAARVLSSAAGEPAAFYKDANVRNFLVTPAGIVLIDFDDLTLAPFGYDLAKLILTAAMTHGPLPAGVVDRALDAYNEHTVIPCTPVRLSDWLEIHHILTSPYLGRNGYGHSWHTLRPEKPRTL